MYGSISPCSSVHYTPSSTLSSADDRAIKFLDTSSDFEVHYEPTTNRKFSTARDPDRNTLESTQTDKSLDCVQFESQVRTRKIQEKVGDTKKFFQLYKLRGYLSFLENILPKIDDTRQKLSDFCDETEETLNSVTEEDILSFSKETEEVLQGLSHDFSDFDDAKQELTKHLDSLGTELNAVEDLMKRIFCMHYSEVEYSRMEELIQNLYTPPNMKDPPNFDKCLQFINCSLEEKRLQILGFKALLKTMENCGMLQKFNGEIIRLTNQVYEFQKSQVSEEAVDAASVWNLFPAEAKLLFSNAFVTIYTLPEQESGGRGYLQASTELDGLVRLSTEVEGDENLWLVKPVPETKAHYFFLENKRHGNLLGLKREGPEYRQIHHRPFQPGYFNQHWLLLLDNTGRFILKNRAHFDLVLTSNGQSNVQGCLLLHENLQYWKIEALGGETLQNDEHLRLDRALVSEAPHIT